ncbi:MAG: hypothetical protein LLG43_11680, partial [Deltaproteobacteria bacterium]|nr:hypothetical protein [Deltaproteobacteria bacterium]
ITQTPTTLPIVHLVIMLEKVTQSISELNISLHMPAEPKPISFDYPATPNAIIGKDLNIVIGIAPFKINAVGDCKFDIRIKKDSDPVISHSFAIKIRSPKS